MIHTPYMIKRAGEKKKKIVLGLLFFYFHFYFFEAGAVDSALFSYQVFLSSKFLKIRLLVLLHTKAACYASVSLEQRV